MNPCDHLTTLMYYRYSWTLFGLALIIIGCFFYKRNKPKQIGNLSASWSNIKIVLSNSPFETILFAMGAAIIIVSMAKGIETSRSFKVSNKPGSDTLQHFTAESNPIQLPKDSLNIDSFYIVAKNKMIAKSYLQAYKLFCITRGIAYSMKKPEAFMKDIDYNIKLTEDLIQEKYNKTQVVSSFEETQSVKINDEDVDTLNK